jgi:Ran GTPase-activating protein (RanGAP) involved in mRNA processing and transport
VGSRNSILNSEGSLLFSIIVLVVVTNFTNQTVEEMALVGSMSTVFDGVCIDDGTGHNVFYLENGTGRRHDQLPEGKTTWKAERLATGELKYYNRGTCTRCRKKSGPVALSMGNQQHLFALNLCEACTLASTSGVPRLRGHGDRVWAHNADTPKMYYADMVALSLDPRRDSNLLIRAIEAKYYTMREAKARRNVDRKLAVQAKAADRGVKKGQVACWGSNDTFNEYCGELNPSGEPEGYGVMFYADGSVYVGGWRDGMWHISDGTSVGKWSSSKGTIYEGTFLYGLKHGRGKQTFEDGAYYEGEFAKGFEHGSGRIVYPDGSVFTGKFRFGRRDGPGELVSKERLTLEKGVFRDQGMPFQDVYPPAVEELSRADVQGIQEAGLTALFDPESLLNLCFKAISTNLKEPRLVDSDGGDGASTDGGKKKKGFRKNGVIKPYDVAARAPMYLKRRLSVRYIDESVADKGIGSPQFRHFLLNSDIGFTLMEELNCGGVRLEPADVSVLSVVQGANTPMKSLKLVSCTLGVVAINNLMNLLAARLWPDLLKLDLSFNLLDMSSIKSIFDALPAVLSLRELRLSGCGIRPPGAAVVAAYLSTNDTLESLDLGFNMVEANGAELLARALEGGNDSLKALNLRRNNIGMAGGEAFIRALKKNAHIEMLCLADNQIGADLSSAIGSRLHGAVAKVMKSTCADQVRIPPRYLKLLARSPHH